MTAESIQANWKAQGAGHWLVRAWQDGLRRALECMAGAEPAAAVRLQALVPEPEAWSAWPSPVWCSMTLQPGGAALAAGAPRPTVQTLARLIAGDAQLPDRDCDTTFVEFLSQTASAAAAVVSGRTGQPRHFSPPDPGTPPPSLECPVQIDLLWQGVLYPLALVPAPALLEQLPGDGVPAQVLPPLGGAASPLGSAVPSNLDLLLEVELPLVVTFGRTQLPLKDVLKLSSGSIVELNRLANEPVEVLINNSVIARGEVVVVDGNYGIRVTEIVSRQERIRSIF